MGRRFLWCAILLGSLLSSSAGADPRAAATLDWVLTSHGWRRPSEALLVANHRQLRLHPLVLGAFQASASILALLLLEPVAPGRRSR